MAGKQVSRSERFQRRMLVRASLFIGLAVVGVVYSKFYGAQSQSTAALAHDARRELAESSSCQNVSGTRWCGMAVDPTSCEYVSEYPRDAFTHEDCQNGAILLHFIGMFYMFMALSIICDEFFVPALEEMTFVRLKLSPDVAGATFMAAGGSAPELATSFIGTFTESSVGFGTIVGSAVFNVLFVIGACAFFSRETLELTAYPLARDSLWYIICLILLAMFFSGISASQIEWGEALVMFLCYVGYVIIMVNNEWLKKITHPCLGGGQKVDPLSLEAYESSFDDIATASSAKQDAEKETKAKGSSVAQYGAGYFRSGIYRLMTQRTTIEMTMAYHLVSQIPGDVKETFDNLDEEKNGRIEVQNIRHLLIQLGHKNPSEEEIKEAMKDLDDDNSGDVDYEEFKTWYTTSESRFVANMHNEFDNVDEDNSGGIDKMELKGLLSKLGHEFSESEVESTFKELDTDGDGVIDRDEFALWYRRDRPYEKQMQVAQEAQDQDEESLLAVPDTVGGKIIYILTLPLVVLFVFTVPDVRKTGKLGGCKISDWFLFSFIMSIVWIGICSYFMVWMAVTIGKTLGIDDKIMGLTFLAAGTSVPDLLTSVLVAMKGEGDMAVSSSIGSNIFDVTVGLPLPWLAYTLSKGQNFRVGSEGVGISIITLVIMLIAVIVSIAAFGWKMSKSLGATMFFMYIIFVLFELLRDPQLNWWPALQTLNF